MIDDNGHVRPHYRQVADYLQSKTFLQLEDRQAYINKLLLSLGITFNVYYDAEGTERIFPFDLIPRIVSANEWYMVEKGLIQRITALNLFINDVYHRQNILNDGIIPKEIVLSSKGYLPQCVGIHPPKGIWCHITGTDLIRDQDSQFYVLEDNLRCPSGVAYVLENREIMKRSFSTLMQSIAIQPVSNYPSKLLELLKYVAANDGKTCAVLTPGIYNSAYFEHSFLARQMGIELVQPTDLVVHGDYVMMQTTKGLKKVDVIYRRVDDTYLDPTVFNPDSMLGVPGLFNVYRKGNISLVNAPGTGVADDKVVYSYVPKMIRYYLNEDPIIPNVETYVCADPKQLAHVLENLDKFVVKAANEAGGYGMLVGPHSTQEQQEEFRLKLLESPRNYIAQPTLQFSRCPSLFGSSIEGRHVDLRPYILYGENIFVLPGGLTRVALRKGSLVVNSSQGGGSKDTWVLAE
ncbi:circularly permuted type 2 ATP-grasp protein [bacterium]|nr:circularly permuted type 2 ATP-grasp protein [bacterium]